MESVPVWRETVEVISWVAVSMVAITSPGKLNPLRTARTSLPSGDRPMDWTTPVPFDGWLVAIVVTTDWVLRLMTETPPPLPAFATYRSPALLARVKPIGSRPTETVRGVVKLPEVVVALHVVALKHSTLLLEPSATYTTPFVEST